MKTVHMLLVEDNAGDIALTLDAFEERKIKVEISVVKNGQDALDFLFKKGKYIDAKKPDLILLDINLPIFNGHEVVEHLRDFPDLEKIPVIMLTTSSNPTDINLAFENRCFSYFVKPLDLDEFLEHILKMEKFTLRLSTIAD